METNHYGCRLLVGRYQAGTTVYSGLLWLQSVEFRFCGQGGYFSPRDPRYTIAFRSSRDTSVGSYVRDCAIHHGYTSHWCTFIQWVMMSRNVVWRTTDSAFKIGGRDNQALDNLAIHTTTIQPNNPLDNQQLIFQPALMSMRVMLPWATQLQGALALDSGLLANPVRKMDNRPALNRSAINLSHCLSYVKLQNYHDSTLGINVHL